jgi:hypothetical protein
MSQYSRSLVRLLLPAAAGIVTGLLATIHKHISPQLVAAIAPVASYLYYLLAGALEKRYAWAKRLFVVGREVTAEIRPLVAPSSNGTTPPAA